ncbi:plasmid replication DNA-binding protein KfrA [Vogesella indigofera]|uniref:Plasmid replication DNA-binding protein KfrA n=1 Tax=Vogesella indigofera TaxID=45465 RepID=A0A495BKZ1_VOGIN|nr:DNA-binding protein [Vogesella indigofera]RKQ61282.1 plasmid replication DNA-binding protein KfrA [Vogesella indigofera]
MARSGIYKSEVLRARDNLLAQGRNPSIDAIRAELGNTGSKTTIHRYLKELEEEEDAGSGAKIAVSEAIQELVGRLAARLHEEADERIAVMAAESAAQLAQCREQLAQITAEAQDSQQQLQQVSQTLTTEQQAHAATRQALQAAQLRDGQQQQQIIGLQERLAENQAHRASLEEKHQHAREALEHYRQSVKEQRDQEQRRHEQQVQQLQAELRTLGQTLIVKQDELTRVYQDSARTGAELLAVSRTLRQQEQENARQAQAMTGLQARIVEQERLLAVLNERLEQAISRREEVWQLLQQVSTAPAVSTGDGAAEDMEADGMAQADTDETAAPSGSS